MNASKSIFSLGAMVLAVVWSTVTAPESSARKIVTSVTASVIAAGIIGALSIFSATFRGWELKVLGWIKTGAVAVGHFLASPHGVPGWLIVLTIIAGFLLVRSWIRRLPKIGPDYRDYTKDTFEGVTWCWSYYGGQISGEFLARCPVCQQALVYREESELTNRRGMFGREFAQVTVYRCENCGGDVARCQGSARDVQGRVLRFVDRKLQTGEWQQTTTWRNLQSR